MQYLYQFLIILGFSALGEALNQWIPFPIPASVYGIVLLFTALQTGLIKGKWVGKAGSFFQSLLPLVFVAPVVNLISCWSSVSRVIVPVFVIMIVSTVVVFALTGLLTQWLRRRKEMHHD